MKMVVIKIITCSMVGCVAGRAPRSDSVNCQQWLLAILLLSASCWNIAEADRRQNELSTRLTIMTCILKGCAWEWCGGEGTGWREREREIGAERWRGYVPQPWPRNDNGCCILSHLFLHCKFTFILQLRVKHLRYRTCETDISDVLVRMYCIHSTHTHTNANAYCWD